MACDGAGVIPHRSRLSRSWRSACTCMFIAVLRRAAGRLRLLCYSKRAVYSRSSSQSFRGAICQLSPYRDQTVNLTHSALMTSPMVWRTANSTAVNVVPGVAWMLHCYCGLQLVRVHVCNFRGRRECVCHFPSVFTSNPKKYQGGVEFVCTSGGGGGSEGTVKV